jgi:hypothetical protein
MTASALVRGLATVSALAALAVPAATAVAAPPEVGHFAGTETFGPEVTTDLPCLEGTAFTLTGGESFRGTFVAKDGAFTLTNQEKFFGTLVPVDGQGPT